MRVRVAFLGLPRTLGPPKRFLGLAGVPDAGVGVPRCSVPWPLRNGVVLDSTGL